MKIKRIFSKGIFISEFLEKFLICSIKNIIQFFIISRIVANNSWKHIFFYMHISIFYNLSIIEFYLKVSLIQQ